MVGNDFVVRRPRLELAAPIATEELTLPSITPVITSSEEIIPVSVVVAAKPERKHDWPKLPELAYRHSLIVFAMLILLVGASGIEVGARYWEARTIKPVVSTAKKPTITGMSLAVPMPELQQKLQQITSQPASLTVGDQTVAINSDTIKSWLQISADQSKGEDYIYIKKDAISKSLDDMAKKFEKAPINQVTVTHDGTEQVVVAGRNGAALTDPSTLTTQARDVAKTVMDAKGLQFSTPLGTQAFQAVTPANFSKLIEVNVVSKQMWLYDNGNVTRSYPISAGKPSTPTPIGQFRIYAKFATQDMKGVNPNGTPYLQPHVHWINYFLPGGYAVHGVYWHPQSWFGAINSSHGCVGLPDDQAEWVYDWAPVGTTVITHV